jgi:steroid delta-isomerase-like uncharacterized protein
MGQSENVAAIERAVQHMNAGNVDGYLELYGDDLTLHGYPPGVEGKDGVSEFYRAFSRALPDLRLAVEDVVEGDDTVAVRYSIRGTHSDELMGVPATGNKLELEGQSFFRFENGRVVERWQSLDGAALLTQLGVLPAPAEA